MDVLIGATGFVGRILTSQRDFGARFNSQTIDHAVGRTFDAVVCAAAPGSMFEANRSPKRDWRRIEDLVGRLRHITTRRFVLISTIATLAGFAAADEDNAVYEGSSPYGVNRRRLEAFVEDHFPEHLIVRLPALFGPGLKKNFIFDILNPMPSMLTDAKLGELRSCLDDNLGNTAAALYAWNDDLGLYCLDRSALNASGRRAELDAAIDVAGMSAIQFTSPHSRFQYYNMAQLWPDIERGLAGGIRVLHLAPSPISASEAFRSIAGREMPENTAPVHVEDMRTGRAALWGRSGPYIAEPAEVREAIVSFVRQEQAA